MKVIEALQHNIKRLALIATMMVALVMGLVACGDATTTTTTDPIATTAPSSSSDSSSTASDTPMSESSPMAGSSIEEPTQPVAVSNDTITLAETPATGSANPATSDQQPALSTDPMQSGTGASAAGTQINATLKEWALDLSQKEVPAGAVQFTVTIDPSAMMRHNLTVQDSSGSQIGQTTTFAAADGPQTLSVDLKPGTYKVICSLPGHAQRGQQTELVVK